MSTVEASCIFSIVLLVIASLINGSLHLHQKITGYCRSALKTELQSHSPDQEKLFRPEELIRSATLLEQHQEDLTGNISHDD